MWIIFVIALVVLGCFGAVLLVGAPYLPTLRPQIKTALDMLDLRPGDTMLELGCGDGRVLLAAAQRGWNCVGYELNPFLAALCWARTIPHRKQIKIVRGDYWRASWPEAQGIYGFILQRYMAKLDKKIMQQPGRPIKLVSFAFTITKRRPIAKQQGLYLYEYR